MKNMGGIKIIMSAALALIILASTGASKTNRNRNYMNLIKIKIINIIMLLNIPSGSASITNIEASADTDSYMFALDTNYGSDISQPSREFPFPVDSVYGYFFSKKGGDISAQNISSIIGDTL